MTPAEQPKPPYQRIADDLRSQIEQGDLAPGAQLPSIRVLAEKYGSGTMTIQRAIGLLRESGAITTSQGLGAFVRVPGDADSDVPVSVVDHITAMEADIKHLSETLAALKRRVQEEGSQASKSS